MLSFFSLLLYGVCSAAVLPPSSSQVLLPKPTGPHKVGRSVTELVDYSRNQPFSNETSRRLMVSVFYPLPAHFPSVPGAYMPPETARIEDNTLSGWGLAAPNGTFEKVALDLASSTPIGPRGHQDSREYPLVVFMPGQGTTRLFYSQIVSTVASNGYIVVNIDPPYDVDVVEYPDDSLAIYNITMWDNPNQTQLAETGYIGIQTRVEDVSFVLDELSNSTLAHSLVPHLPPYGLNTTHTAMFGHSLGGATAYSILEADDRILGGMNMDSGLYGPAPNSTNKPFFLMGQTIHTREFDPTWAAAWSTLKGWRRDVLVAETLHYDFSDYPVLFETLGITPTPAIAQGPLYLGNLGGTRALEIVTTYATAFLDFVILGEKSPLLDGPVPEFEEVTFEY